MEYILGQLHLHICPCNAGYDAARELRATSAACDADGAEAPSIVPELSS